MVKKEKMMKIVELNQIISNILNENTFPDNATNGIEVETTTNISRIQIAVDASLDSINAAVKNKVDCLIVHHGLWWGACNPLVGSFFQRIKPLIINNIGLISYHLPLDVSSKIGNNVIMLAKMNAQIIKPLGYGFIGLFNESVSIEQIINSLEIDMNKVGRYLNFGSKDIKKVLVCSGGGVSGLNPAISEGCDLFITGELPHYAVNIAKEARINVLVGGHYHTETFGIRALGDYLAKNYQIDVFYDNFDTGF